MTEYTETTFNDQPAREYPDGSIRNEQGHWLTRHPGSATVIDSDRSQELHARKAAKKQVQEQEFQEEVQRALVSQVAGAKTPAGAVGAWVGHLASEMDAKSAPKEHGISNYVKVLKEVGQMAGLIQEKVTDNRQVNIENINLSQDAEAHVAMLLERLQERLLTRED